MLIIDVYMVPIESLQRTAFSQNIKILPAFHLTTIKHNYLTIFYERKFPISGTLFMKHAKLRNILLSEENKDACDLNNSYTSALDPLVVKSGHIVR